MLEKGKYEEGDKFLSKIATYNDVPAILEQMKWKTVVYECVNDLKKPDSLQIYDVSFYYGFKDELSDLDKSLLNNIVGETNDKPVCVMYRGAQNGAGDNTTGYSLFIYSDKDGRYRYLGTCSTLNEKDDKLIYDLIKIFSEKLNKVGDVNLDRIKSNLKNDSYSTIKP